MPHKIYDKKAIERARDTVAYYDKMIIELKGVAAGDKDSMQHALDAIREMEFDSGYRKDTHLKRGSEVDTNLARGYRYMQEAYQTVLVLFEKPQELIGQYESEKQVSVGLLKEAEEYEQRNTEKNR